jgi:deferrochelatase/peroxidase EfeB
MTADTVDRISVVRLASPDENAGQRILRRGSSYSEAPAPGSGQLDAGLFFICSSATQAASSPRSNGVLGRQTP